MVVVIGLKGAGIAVDAIRLQVQPSEESHIHICRLLELNETIVVVLLRVVATQCRFRRRICTQSISPNQIIPVLLKSMEISQGKDHWSKA